LITPPRSLGYRVDKVLTFSATIGMDCVRSIVITSPFSIGERNKVQMLKSNADLKLQSQILPILEGSKVKLTFCYKPLSEKKSEVVLILVPLNTLKTEDPFTVLLKFNI
jgi:hypothetical protein